MRSILMRVLPVVGSVLIMIGALFSGWLVATEEERNVINVRVSEENTQTVTFEGLRLVPGDQREYTILLDRSKTKTYDVKLDFTEEEERELKHFVRAKIIADGQQVCDELLATLVEGDDIILPALGGKEKQTELTIVYYLPAEVGNEAKNAEAKFLLQITASNE